jgi:cellobiose phosphorylase
MYRLLIETLLGVHREGDNLRLEPRMPAAWTTYKVHYRYRQTVYHITFTRLAAETADPTMLLLDGQEVCGDTIPLTDDRQEHAVEMKIRD